MLVGVSTEPGSRKGWSLDKSGTYYISLIKF